MKSLTIIGGSGFLGKSILLLFINKKLAKFKISKIYCISRNKIKIQKLFRKNKNITFIKGDISKLKNIPDTNYYIYAATSSESKSYTSKPKKEFQNMIFGLKNFLKIIKKKKLYNSKMIFLSSGAIYGLNSKKKLLKENTIINKENYNLFSKEKKIYALGKYKSEEIIKEFLKNHKFNFTILRCFAFFGPTQPIQGHFFISNLISAIKKGVKLKIRSKNLHNIYRSYMHTDDMVNLFFKIFISPYRKLQLFNLGSDKYYSLFNILHMIKKKYNLKIVIPKQDSSINIKEFYIPDISRIKKKFNYRIRNSFINDFDKILKQY